MPFLPICDHFSCQPLWPFCSFSLFLFGYSNIYLVSSFSIWWFPSPERAIRNGLGDVFVTMIFNVNPIHSVVIDGPCWYSLQLKDLIHYDLHLNDRHTCVCVCEYEGSLERKQKANKRTEEPLHFVGWLLALRPSNMLVYLRDGSAQTSVCAAMLR